MSFAETRMRGAALKRMVAVVADLREGGGDLTALSTLLPALARR
jgi:hypothetical protein